MAKPSWPRWRWGAIAFLALLAAGVAGAAIYRDRSAAPAPMSRWVRAESRVVNDTVSATGTLRLRTGAEVRVGAQISGIVVTLNVSVGSRVKVGDVIAEIDSRPTRAAVAVAQAQLAHDEVALAKAALDDARMQRLRAEQAIAVQQADDSAAALALAKATVAASKRALEAAQVNLDYVTIRAPIGGTVASVATQRGETVAAAFATPTFVTIIADNALEVVAMVDEADIGAVRVGQAASFDTETYPDRDFAGRVVRIAPVATIVSGVVNYEVGIAISGDMSALKPDMTANVTIATAERRAVFVPLAAIRQDTSGRYVIGRTRGGAPAARRIVTAGRNGNDVEIVGGVAAGDLVLVEEKS